MIREVIVETVMKIKVKKIVWILVKKRPVRVAIHSLEVSFEINLMPFFLIPKKNPRSHTCVCIGCGYDKNGMHYKTSEGLTNDIQYIVMRRTKTVNTDLNSRVRYLKIPWENPNSNEYTKAIEVINDC